VRLQAGVLEWNRASYRVLDKAGYRLEAHLWQQNSKDGEVCDMWELLHAILGMFQHNKNFIGEKFYAGNA
jgi:RimJ/RimL family protein N-acetyltransferase